MKIFELRWLRIALIVLAIISWIVGLILPNYDEPSYDLSALLVGAKLVADGNAAHLYAHHAVFYNIADDPEFMRAANELGFTGTVPTAFVQAPLIAWVAQPLTHLWYPSVAHGWLLVSAVAMVAAVYLALDAYAPRYKSALPALCILLVAFEPVRYNFWLGQTTPFIFLAMMGSIALVRRQRMLEAGLLMALPAFVKLTPLIFGVVWLWQKRWRAFVGLCVGVAALAMVSVITMGISANLSYLHRVSEIGRIALVAFNNHSLSALLTRPGIDPDELHKFTMFTPSPTTRIIVASAALAIIAIPGCLLRRHRTDDLVEGFALLFGLLIPSISWTHYFVLVVPLVLLVIARRRRVATVGAILFALPCFRPIAPDGSSFLQHPGLCMVGPTVAALGLLGSLVYLSVLRSREPT